MNLVKVLERRYPTAPFKDTLKVASAKSENENKEPNDNLLVMNLQKEEDTPTDAHLLAESLDIWPIV